MLPLTLEERLLVMIAEVVAVVLEVMVVLGNVEVLEALEEVDALPRMQLQAFQTPLTPSTWSGDVSLGLATVSVEPLGLIGRVNTHAALKNSQKAVVSV